ncbi:MAG: NfeD family protein [Clostridia bacterium]|nr:NfeD family protein [Clostridia bacterium]
MGILWLAAIVAFGILEAVTFQFICIWFAGGALGALIAYLLGTGVLAQSITFVAVSVVLLICTRPLVRRLTKNSGAKTNAESLIGDKAVMTRSTDAMGTSGELKAGGTYWTVKSSDGQPIEKDAVVTIEKIEGVKLIVKK